MQTTTQSTLLVLQMTYHLNTIYRHLLQCNAQVGRDSPHPISCRGVGATAYGLPICMAPHLRSHVKECLRNLNVPNAKTGVFSMDMFT